MKVIRERKKASVVLIVGAGGLGSQLVHALIQNDAVSRSAEITLVDFDVVEEKNIRNQLYNAEDVGKPKVNVLADRLKAAGFASVRCMCKQIQQCAGALERAPELVFGCVDNVETRCYLAHSFRLVLDFGSEGKEGSVRFYGPGFAPFDRAIFWEGRRPLCVGEAGPEPQAHGDEIVTFAETNRAVVRQGLLLLHRYELGDYVADLTHLNLEAGEYVRGIFLRRGRRGKGGEEKEGRNEQEGGGDEYEDAEDEEVWIRDGRIVQWEQLGIHWDGDLFDVDVFLV